jgi:hypothetical protein
MVPAQLALTGVVTGTSPVGGSVVGIHPGDVVDLKAAPAGLSTQGLNDLGIPAGDLLGSLVGSLVGYQVVLHLPATFPGGPRDVTLGPCGGKADLKVTFPNKGTYGFTWSAYSVTVLPLLGCTVNRLTLDGNQLAKAGIALNAANQWIGKIVVAADPPGGGLSVQLPGVSAAPNVGGLQLPTTGVAGPSLPTLPVTPPRLNPGLPAGSTRTTPARGGSAGQGSLDYTPPPASVEESVVPKGYGCCDSGQHAAAGALESVLLNGLAHGTSASADGLGVLPAGGQDAGGGSARILPSSSAAPLDLASNKAPAGQVPVLLAILAIIALSLVTATYARMCLMRRHVA